MSDPQPSPAAMEAAMKAMLRAGIDSVETAAFAHKPIARALDAFAEARSMEDVRRVKILEYAIMARAGVYDDRAHRYYVDEHGAIRARGKGQADGK